MGFVRLKYSVVLEDDGVTRLALGPPNERLWTAGAGDLGKVEAVELPGDTFTALTPPDGAKAVVLILGTAAELVLKGITGDTGVEMTPASNPLGIDAILPLGDDPSLGILNDDTEDVTIQVAWL